MHLEDDKAVIFFPEQEQDLAVSAQASLST